MNFIRLLIGTIIVTFIFSYCNSSKTNNEIEYYQNGEIKYELDSNGRLKEFYKNGQLKSTKQFINNELIGWAYFYSKNGFLQVKREYILVDTISSYLNQVIYFNEHGDTLKGKSNYFSLYSSDDTIVLGEEYKLIVKLDAPYFKKSQMAVFIADYDSLYNIADTSKVEIRVAKDYKAIYEITPLKIGEKCIRGVINEYINKIDSLGNEYSDVRYLYFKKKYFVEAPY